MSLHCYPARAVRADYLRAGLGMALTGGPLLVAQPGVVAVSALAGLAGLFALYGVRTWVRQRTTVEVTDDGISTAGASRVTLPWREVRGVTLKYYSTRRDRTGGWMQLSLAGRGRTLRLDSSIDGFDAILARAASTAHVNRLALAPATVSNFSALGIPVAGGEGDAEARWPIS